MARKKGTKNTPPKLIQEIVEKHRQGRTKNELAKEYGKPYKTIKNMVTRENNKARKLESGELPAKLGRPRKATSELEQLRMENELLRDFLQACGRGRGQN